MHLHFKVQASLNDSNQTNSKVRLQNQNYYLLWSLLKIGHSLVKFYIFLLFYLLLLSHPLNFQFSDLNYCPLFKLKISQNLEALLRNCLKSWALRTEKLFRYLFGRAAVARAFAVGVRPHQKTLVSRAFSKTRAMRPAREPHRVAKQDLRS